jgi:hypothetical protein
VLSGTQHHPGDRKSRRCRRNQRPPWSNATDYWLVVKLCDDSIRHPIRRGVMQDKALPKFYVLRRYRFSFISAVGTIRQVRFQSHRIGWGNFPVHSGVDQIEGFIACHSFKFGQAFPAGFFLPW